jgi:hypothetical protein
MKTLNMEIFLKNISTAKPDTAILVPQHLDRPCLIGVSGTFLHLSNTYGSMYEYGIVAKNNKLYHGDLILTGKRFINAALLDIPAKEAGETIEIVVYQALRIADERGFSVIAMPALGTEENGVLSFEKSANAMMRVITKYEPKKLLEKVEVYILKNQESFKIYKSVAESVIRKNLKSLERV